MSFAKKQCHFVNKMEFQREQAPAQARQNTTRASYASSSQWSRRPLTARKCVQVAFRPRVLCVVSLKHIVVNDHVNLMVVTGGPGEMCYYHPDLIAVHPPDNDPS